jgi:hypothetical protein
MGLINNFELISNLLRFDIKNSFYEITILKRRKENPTLNKNSKTINIYYIYSKEEFFEKMNDIIEDCESNNARAYINMNAKDAYKATVLTNLMISTYLLEYRFDSTWKAYNKACGDKKVNLKSNPVWIIDIDVIDENGVSHQSVIDKAESMIETICGLHKLNHKKQNYSVIGKIPTKNGFHILTNPFNRVVFDEKFPGTCYYMNSPTILYI